MTSQLLSHENRTAALWSKSGLFRISLRTFRSKTKTASSKVIGVTAEHFVSGLLHDMSMRQNSRKDTCFTIYVVTIIPDVRQWSLPAVRAFGSTT